MTAIHRVELRPQQALLLGTGRGAGYSTASALAIPAATLLGAIASAHAGAGSGDTAELMAATSITDATAISPVPLDRATCKYPQDGCPDSYPWARVSQACPCCGNRPERSKGEPRGMRRVTRTRVGLDHRGRAEPEKLFARDGVITDDGETLTAHLNGDPEALGLRKGTQLRLGGARSVTGLALVKDVQPLEAGTVTAKRLRLVLASRGVFVDDFGFPIDRPTPRMIQAALGHQGTVERAFVRWTTAGGWARLPDRPKPEDPAVIAGSVFHIVLEEPASVPTIGANLGIRGFEGCGWFMASALDQPDPAASPAPRGVDPARDGAGA